MSMQKHEPYIAFKRWLAGQGLTYKDIARVINCTEATEQLKINGKSDFYNSEIIAICEQYNLDYAIFFEEKIA